MIEMEIVATTVPRKREDFLMETFRYLEAELHKIRNKVTILAAKRAEDRQKDRETYVVEKQDIDAVLPEVLQTWTASAPQTTDK